MNKYTRLIFSVAPRVPTTRFLIKLHWLPIKARIEFKICLIVFKALRFGQPKYIADVLSMSCGVGHITKNSANVFSACRKRRLKETGRGDWKSPPLYIFPQRQHERGGVAGRLTSP